MMFTALEHDELKCGYCHRSGHTVGLGCPRWYYRWYRQCIFCGGSHRGEVCTDPIKTELYEHYRPARARLLKRRTRKAPELAWRAQSNDLQAINLKIEVK